MGAYQFIAVSILLVLFLTCCSSSVINPPTPNDTSIQSKSSPQNSRTSSQNSVTKYDDAQSSTNFYTSDLGVAEGSYDPSTDYGTFFDHFPELPYFPEFGEIFRVSRTTTPRPPFRFPSYVRDAFPDIAGKSLGGASSAYSDSIGGGGRRPQRRPPRPASSGTRTKVTKQNQSEPKEKPRSTKTKSPNKARNFPKIFRFTSDRVNLADFDMKKKVNENYLALTKGDELDSDKVKRNEFLILHGGVFEIESRNRPGLLAAASTNRHMETTPTDDFIHSYESDSNPEELESARYFYKT